MDQIWILLGSFVVGFVSAIYGVAVGGGALLTVPALLFFGLPPVHAIATSRLGSLGVSLSGLLAFRGSGQIHWKLGWQMAFLISLGSALGAFLLLNIPVFWVKKGIASTILLVLALLLLFPQAGIQPQRTNSKSWRYRSGFVLTVFLGILTGFYQGGSGTLAAYIMILCFGQTFLESAGTRKIPFLLSNLVILAVLWPAGTVHLDVGLALGGGTFVGGYLGGRYALRKGNQWVKWVFIVVVGLSGLRMLLRS